MADVQAAGGITPAFAGSAEQYRAVTFVAYLACLGIVTAPLGASLAYLMRAGARGTVYESHLANTIDLFWVTLVVGVVSVPLVFLFGLGVLIEAGLLAWLVARVVKGVGGAIEARPHI